MQPSVRADLEAALGSSVTRASGVSGGDINQAFAVSLAEGRRVFVKTNPSADPEMFPAEAHGLGWLRAAGALRVPEVLAVSASFLALEWLESARPRADFDERLGRGLAALHRAGADGFGLERANFIGRLPQPNAPTASWAAFYRERRLGPMLERAARDGLLPSGVVRELERLLARLEGLVGPAEPPARLHGDLWGGNLLADELGQPAVIDPAAYGGHREIDLAMMKLFGGFGARAFAAYHEAFPLAAGHAERVPLYQLYPLLVHALLFGGGYAGSVGRVVARYAG